MDPSDDWHLDVTTPTLVIDLDTLEANVATMAATADDLAMALRPHAKTHKSVAVARRQLAAGAVGLSVATLGEAEIFGEAGIDDLFIAYPLWADARRAVRLAALAERCRLVVGTDSVAAVSALGRAFGGDRRGAVAIEIDCGQHRSGVAPGDALGVARAASDAGLEVVGLFTFPGHSYSPGTEDAAAEEESTALERAGEQLEAAGFTGTLRSGGSTPSASSARAPVNELRPGVYVFNDAQQLALGNCGPDAVALFALATVVSAERGRFVLDTGSKILGADRPPWLEGHGLLPDFCGARITGLSEHHGVVVVGEDAGYATPHVGQQIRVVPNHVCNAVNLVDHFEVLQGAASVDRWPVDARGALS